MAVHGVNRGGDGAGVSGYTKIVKTADTGTITSATPANVTVGAAGGGNMELAVVSGRRYRIRATWCYQSDTGTTGFVAALTAPADTRFAVIVHGLTSADGAAGGFQGSINSSGDSVAIANTAVANQDYVVIGDGIIVPSASGNLVMQAANEAGAGNITVCEGTCLELWDLSV